jgi:hypothetical protein
MQRRSETHGADSSAGVVPPARRPAVRATCHGDAVRSWENVAPSSFALVAQAEQCAQRYALPARSLRKNDRTTCMGRGA